MSPFKVRPGAERPQRHGLNERHGRGGQRRLEERFWVQDVCWGGSGQMIEPQPKGKRAHPAGILTRSRNWDLT